MKKIFLFIILICSSIILSQQINDSQLAKLDPLLKLKFQNYFSSKQLKELSVTSSHDSTWGVIIRTKDAATLIRNNVNVNSIYPDFVTARITLNDLAKIITLQSVEYVSTPKQVKYDNDIANTLIGSDLLHQGYVNGSIYDGTNILISTIDSGIDWSHYDFRDPTDATQSRILYIWDQTLTKTGSEVTPEDRDATFTGLNYGVEYTKAQIETELTTPTGFVREQDVNGHGTHVMGTAVGNGSSLSSQKYSGIAPKADIIAIKTNNSTTSIIDGITYASKIAAQLGKPIVLNLSLGTQSNPHDGSTELDAAVDNFVGSGKVVVVSAGNEGSNSIHTTGSISGGTNSDITFTTPTYTATDDDRFTFDLWFNSIGTITARVTSPNGYQVTKATSGTTGGISTADGWIDITNNTNYNKTEIIVTIMGDNTKSICAGQWTLSVKDSTGNEITYHGWLTLSNLNGSTVTLNGGNSQYTVGSPGSASKAITVGSFVSREKWYGSDGSIHNSNTPFRSDNISSLSSIGPRVDNVQKPEITAPGENIISSLSGNATVTASDIDPGAKHSRRSGTSMSAPVVTGAAALLLQQSSTLTSEQVKSYFTDNATSDSFTGSVPNSSWGYGKLNIFKSMVSLINSGWPSSRDILAYDGWSSYGSVSLTNTQKVAVKFTPNFSGKVTGLLFHTNGMTLTGPILAEIWSNDSGIPGLKLGSTVTVQQDNIQAGSWNVINMIPSGVDVTSGTDYHAVFYFTTIGDQLNIATDPAATENRSAFFSGNWSSVSGSNYRLRPIIAVSNSALPVELTSFTATSTNNVVELQWKTATEVNNYGFSVERRVQSVEWKKIAFVNGNGNSNSPKSYSYTDNLALAHNLNLDLLQYRLKQIDFDGKYEYSNAVEVKIDAPSKTVLEQNYPNPFNPETTIIYKVQPASKVSLKVYDLLGREVATLVDEFKQAGTYNSQFSILNYQLSSGVYFYKLQTDNGFSETKKLMIIK